MRSITRIGARWGVLLGVVATGVLLAPASTLAVTVTSPPTVTSAFTPSLIVVGQDATSALSITIANPNASTTLSGIAFTDTLPTGVTVDDPNGESGSCGSTVGVTATPGGSTISLTGGKLAGGANCTVSVDVTATNPGKYTNSTGPIAATQTAKPYSLSSPGVGDTETLTVVGDPTITIAAPTNDPKYAFGQKVKAGFTCTEAPGGPGIASCAGSLNNGDNVNAGGLLPTNQAGPETLTVFATSADGGFVTATANFTVLPDNHVTVKSLKKHSGGAVTLTVKVPGRGTLKALETAGSTAFGAKTVKPGGKGTVKLTLEPTSAGSALLTAAGSAGLTTKLKLVFTPKGGKPGTLVERVHLG